jgi:hypothetical protein
MKYFVFSFIFPGLMLLISCKARWSEEDRERLKKRCIEQDAVRFGFSDPEKHCDCLLKKITAKYPNPNSFENMELGEYGQMVAECQGIDRATRVIWPESTQQAFVDSCTSMARTQGKSDPAGYCKCVLNGIMSRYPTNDSLEKMSPQVLNEISGNCR